MRRRITRTGLAWLLVGGVLGWCLLVSLGCATVDGIGTDLKAMAKGLEGPKPPQTGTGD